MVLNIEKSLLETAHRTVNILLMIYFLRLLDDIFKLIDNGILLQFVCVDKELCSF